MSSPDFLQLIPPSLAPARPDIVQAIEKGIWPPNYFAVLLGPVAAYAALYPRDLTYHHTGFTFPDRRSFEKATTDIPDVVKSDLVLPSVTHHRQYQRIPQPKSSDTFLEYHLAGDEGNGVRGVHFDFIADDPDRFLATVETSLDTASLGARVVTQSFGGGNAPVGKIGLQPAGNAQLEIGVMARSHWSDPRDW